MNRCHESQRLARMRLLENGHRAGVIQEVASALMVEESDLPEMQPYNIPKVLAGIKFSFCPSDEVLDSDPRRSWTLVWFVGFHPWSYFFYLF